MSSAFWNVNRASAAAVALAAAAAFALTYGFDPVPPGLPGLGAVEFPRLICAVLLALAALLFFTEAPPHDPEQAPPLGPGLPIYALCLAFIPAMVILGLLPTIALFMVAAGWLWGERRLPLLVGISILFTAALWAVFVKLFRLTLPGGLIFGG